MIAQIEVNIDYPEYDDAILMSKEMIKPSTLELIEEIKHILEESYKNQLIRDGVKTAIIGKPNVGKSSLLNALLNEEKAIVNRYRRNDKRYDRSLYQYGRYRIKTYRYSRY